MRLSDSRSWSTLVLGSMATKMTGSGNSMDSRTIGLLVVAERVARGGDLEAHGRGDVAGEHLGDVLAVVGVHLQDAADALLLVLVRVVHVRARFERARVHPEVGELADERVGHDLEGDGREGLVVVGAPGDGLAVLGVDAFDRRDVERRGQVVDHRVQQHLHALVLERGAAEHRGEVDVEGGLADGRLEALLARSPRPRGSPS